MKLRGIRDMDGNVLPLRTLEEVVGPPGPAATTHAPAALTQENLPFARTRACNADDLGQNFHFKPRKVVGGDEVELGTPLGRAARRRSCACIRREGRGGGVRI